MGALAGTLSTTAFYIQGDMPDDYRERFLAALNKLRFKEIDLNLDQDEAMGWVNIADPFDTDFDLNKILWGSYFMASIRHDVIRLPATAFKYHLDRRVQEYLQSTGKERITKGEREEVKDQLEAELKRRVLPSIKTYDLVWNLDRRECWLWSTNRKMEELFIDLFEETFGLQAHARNPYSCLERMELDDKLMAKVLQIEPAAMAAPPR